MTVRIHIERLVLDGPPLGRQAADELRGQVEQELTRVLAERGLAADLRSGAAVPALRASESITTDAQPAVLGSRIGQALGATLRGSNG